MRPTAGKLVRAKCLECLGAANGYQAFDCAGKSSPLYACHAFRGKPVPAGREGPNSNAPEVLKRLGEMHAAVPKRQPSKALIRAKSWGGALC